MNLCINSAADSHFLDGDSLPRANVHLNRTFTWEKPLPTLIPHALAFKIQAQQSLNGCWPRTPNCPWWSWCCPNSLGRQVTCQAASPSVTSLCIWIGKRGWRHTVCFVLKPRFVPCVYTVLPALGDSGKEVQPRWQTPLIHCLVGFEGGFGEQKAAFLCGTWPEAFRPLHRVLFIFSWVIISAASPGASSQKSFLRRACSVYAAMVSVLHVVNTVFCFSSVSQIMWKWSRRRQLPIRSVCFLILVFNIWQLFERPFLLWSHINEKWCIFTYNFS